MKLGKSESVKMAILGKNCFSSVSGVGVCRSSVFNIRNFRRAKYLFYVIGNGVDDSFDLENRTRRKFIGTDR